MTPRREIDRGVVAHVPALVPVLVTVLVTVLGVLLLAGCGIPLQDSPQRIEPTPTQPASSSPEAGSSALRIYLVRQGRLQPVARSAADATLPTTVASLAAGAAPFEAYLGLTTAIPPGALGDEREVEYREDTITVSVGEPFALTSGDDQLLATAQVVWTVTETNRDASVRLVSDGQALELPTDEGLTSATVQRQDFGSVAPQPR